jgi:hypothetical protein
MSEQIPRYKPKSDWTPADFLAEQRGTAPPESEEYIEARREALAKAGLSDDDDSDTSNPAEMTSEQHLKRLQGDNR